jgi:hypothetical protein
VDPSTNDEMDLPVTCEKQSSQHKVVPNDEIDLPETCEEENEMDVDLQEPSVVRIVEDYSEGLKWDDVMRKVEAYPKRLKKTKYAFE